MQIHSNPSHHLDAARHVGRSTLKEYFDAKTVSRFIADMPFFRLDFRFNIIIEHLQTHLEEYRAKHQPRFSTFSDFMSHHAAHRSPAAQLAQTLLDSSDLNEKIDAALLHGDFILQLSREEFSLNHLKEHFQMLEAGFIALLNGVESTDSG